MKKIAGLLLVILFCLPGCFLFRKKTRPVEEIKKPTPTPGQTILEFSENSPYVYLTPRGDGHALFLYASHFGEAKYLEYELTYEAEDQLQGAIGRITLRGEEVGPEEILLGTCSKGVCKYDKGVEKGSLEVKFLYKDIREERNWKADFRLQEVRRKGEVVSSDGKFTLDASFIGSGFAVVMPLLSLPQSLEKKIEGVPYGVFLSDGVQIKEGEVSFKFFSPPEDLEKLSVFGWNGEKWVELETKVDREKGTLSAYIQDSFVFVAAHPN